MPAREPRFAVVLRRFGLFAGPVLAIVAFVLLPTQYPNAAGGFTEFTHAGRASVALLVWMATWWMTEAVDLAATSLLPVAMLPLLGAADIKSAAAPYASEFIFLFMGGFILALSRQRWGLDRRIALLTLRIVGTSPVKMIGGCMLATVVMGGFVSNTAMAAMMLPIGLSVIALMRDKATAATPGEQANFATCIVLGIAYAASISGVATLIGTPPNTFVAAFIRDKIEQPSQREITFLQWLAMAGPLSAVLLPVTWLMLTRVLFPVRMKPIGGGREFIANAYAALGPMNRGERVTFIVFLFTAAGWMFRQWIVKIQFGGGESPLRPFALLTDSGIAILGALTLFMIPAGKRLGGGFVMNWPTAARLPWGILILFGGGLSLAQAIEVNGVAEFLGHQAHRFTDLHPIAMVLLVVAAVVMFSEFASNTATAMTVIPILAAIAPGLGVHPYLLIFPATIGCSMAFMMPVGTPPNAMALGTGVITSRQMIFAGFWLNLIGIGLVTAWTFLLMRWMLNV